MKVIVALPVVLGIVILDLITKAVAVAVLAPSGMPNPVFGEWFRFALVYNPGAAFGLNLGAYSRWIFMALTAGALVVLWRLYREAADTDLRRVLAVSLVAAGAIGNVIDRIRSDLGVVDFIDVGIGTNRWPTFNVADIAVTTGAFLLAWVLWGDDRQAALAATPPHAGSSDSSDLSA